MFHHSPMVFNPPPPHAQPRMPSSTPPRLPPPPQIAADSVVNLPPQVPTSIPDLPAPPQPKPQQKKSAAVATPKPVTPAPTEQTAQPPRLGQLFTPEQERDYTHNIDENLDRVKRALAILSQKHLNADQAESATRIAAFQKQAEQARDAHDLANADQLARNAATLAADLLTRVP